MKRRHSMVVSLLILSAVTTAGAWAASVTLPVTTAGLSSFSAEEKPFYVLNIAVPEAITGMRLDTALLEFYVDAGVVALEGIEDSPVISVRALTETFGGTGEPEFSTESGRRRPVVLGEARKVLIDITDVVKQWVASPSTNHGLIVGSLDEDGVGEFTVRSDILGGGKVAAVTFFYQNRFGDRISQRGQ